MRPRRGSHSARRRCLPVSRARPPPTIRSSLLSARGAAARWYWVALGATATRRRIRWIARVASRWSRREPRRRFSPRTSRAVYCSGSTRAPRAYPTSTGPYQPRNYDRRFHGPVRAREALASSYNVPAVELADRVGAATLLRVLHGAGFGSLTRSAQYYGLGLALGNGDVSLLELANGYRGLAASGVWRAVEWRSVGPGQRSAGDRRFISAGSAALVLDILSDPTARIPGFGVEAPFDFPFPAAVKTGTTHHFRAH